MKALIQLSPILLMAALFYLMVLIPEKKRKKKYSELINSLKVNDEIITKGGVIGRIVNLQEDFIILETGPDRARIKFSKNAISSVMDKNKENN